MAGRSWPFRKRGAEGRRGAGACTASMRACVRVYTRCDAMCDEAAMCKNCECDVDGSDGEPMPHIRYAHSEPRGCDVTSGLHAPGSYPPVRSPTVSDLREPSTTRADPLSPPFFLSFFFSPSDRSFPSTTRDDRIYGPSYRGS